MLHIIEPTLRSNKSIEQSSLALARELVRRLSVASIRYCHWKSNQALVQALAGIGDLDLLVDPSDAEPFLAILADLGFKQADPVSRQRQSSIFHYYGLDRASGRLLHVHAYFRLVTGGQILKNYRLPFEDLLLNKTYAIDGVLVPEKAKELLVFVVRKMLEAGGIVELGLQQLDRPHLDRELRWLLPEEDKPRQAILQRVCEDLRCYWPELDTNTWLAGLYALTQRQSLLRQHLVGRRFRHRLRTVAIRRSLVSMFLVASRLATHVGVRLVGICGKKRLAKGGRVVAVMGPEASGKSTTVDMLQQWLKAAFSTRVVHLGKPKSSWIGRAIHCIRSTRQRLKARNCGGSRLRVEDAEASANRSGVAYAIVSVLLARERYHAARLAFRDAARGKIVVCDRYPTARIGAVDGPRLKSSLAHGLSARALTLLAKLERSYYRRIPRPDVVVQLDVPLELATERNRVRVKQEKEGDAYLAVRHDQFHSHSFAHENIRRVDTTGSRCEVMARIREVVWREL